MSDDETKQLLEQLMAELHAQQVKTGTNRGRSYLEGGNGVFLGNIDTNRFDRNSISNTYGPYGSRYSQTSVLNQYSQYGSQYGPYSIRNPNAIRPPKLYVNGSYIGQVSSNPHVEKYIPANEFMYALTNDVGSILDLTFTRKGKGRAARGESFIEASDGTYLGSLVSNNFAADSIFNEFGPYGSQFSPTSIFNQFGTYGNPYSPLSPYNQFSRTAPTVFLRGRNAGQLTKNTAIRNRIDPDTIKDWAAKNVR
jgi:hypothetical protein